MMSCVVVICDCATSRLRIAGASDELNLEGGLK